jgi:hypothetical protein
MIQKEKCTYCKRKSIGYFVVKGEKVYYCTKHRPKKRQK